VIRAVAAIAVSCALLALLLSRLDLDGAMERYRSAEPGWIALASLLSLSVLVLRGIRFASLSDRAGFGVATAAVATQVFLNRVTPLRLGELSLPLLLRRHAGEDTARSLVRLLLVRLVDLAVVVAAIALGAALLARDGSAGDLAPTLGALLLLALLLATYRRWIRWMAAMSSAAARKVGVARLERALARLEDAASQGDDASPASRAVLVATSLGIFVAQMAMFAALLRAFGVHLPVAGLALGGAVAQAGAAIPVASVGTFGTQEASWVAGYVWAGLPLNDAIVTAVAAQVITLAFAAAFALPAWLWLQRRSPREQAADAAPAR